MTPKTKREYKSANQERKAHLIATGSKCGGTNVPQDGKFTTAAHKAARIGKRKPVAA